MMEDVYRSINKSTKTDTCTKANHKSRYDTIYEVATEEANEVSYNRGKNKIHITNPIVALISETIQWQSMQ